MLAETQDFAEGSPGRMSPHPLLPPAPTDHSEPSKSYLILRPDSPGCHWFMPPTYSSISENTCAIHDKNISSNCQISLV